MQLPLNKKLILTKTGSFIASHFHVTNAELRYTLLAICRILYFRSKTCSPGIFANDCIAIIPQNIITKITKGAV